MVLFFTDHNRNFCTSERCQKQLQIVKSNLFLSMSREAAMQASANMLWKCPWRSHFQRGLGSCKPQLHQHLPLPGFCPQCSLCRAQMCSPGEGWGDSRFPPKGTKGRCFSGSTQSWWGLVPVRHHWWSKDLGWHLGSREQSVPHSLPPSGRGRKRGLWVWEVKKPIIFINWK